MMRIERDKYNSREEVQTLKSLDPKWSSKKFSWKIKDNNGRWFDVRKKIKPILLEMTKSHCSFCDVFISSDFFHPSIEHFKPKSIFPLYAYKWENLFISCEGCTEKKGDNYSSYLLKPDHKDYDFEKYFEILVDGRLVPNSSLSDCRRAMADCTLKLYALNGRNDLVKRRKEEIKNYLLRRATSGEVISVSEEVSFRFVYLIKINHETLEFIESCCK